jgi:biopolymer transport protein ExbB/TolQ
VNRISQVIQAVLRAPLLWGAAACAGFYAFVNGPIDIPLVMPLLKRYTMHHPVEYFEVTCFFIGAAVLVIKLIDVAQQWIMFDRPLLPPAAAEGRSLEDCPMLLARLQAAWGRQNHYLVRRLREGLQYIAQRDSAQGLDEQLRRLAENDADRAHADQGLLRLIIWAIPILGFLGTVVGITMALTSLRPDNLEQSMVEVTAGLGVKFDTTALALSLSIVLMFAQFVVDRTESRLLEAVNRHAEAELVGRFPSSQPRGSDGSLPAVHRMGQLLVQTIEQLVVRQSQLWQASIEASQQRWSTMADTAGKQLHDTLAAVLGEGLTTHAQQVAAIEAAAGAENRRNWEQVQQALSHGAESSQSLQTSIVRQGEILNRALEASGEVMRLEDALNHNLAALAGAKHFEETVVSLAAAIQLLTSRLGDLPDQAREVRLEPARRPQAA